MCGYGGIGRRARFRIWYFGVQVRPLLPARLSAATAACGRVIRFAQCERETLMVFPSHSSFLPSIQSLQIVILSHWYTSQRTSLPSKYPVCGPGIFHMLRRCSFSAKGHARLICSVVNALATVRCRSQPFAACACGAASKADCSAISVLVCSRSIRYNALISVFCGVQ